MCQIATERREMVAKTKKTEALNGNIEEISVENDAYAQYVVFCPGFAGLNVREKAGAKSDVLRVLAEGEKVAAAPPKRGWQALQGGGFVKAEFLVRP